MKNNEIEQTNSRRSFMKKAAYAVPTVIAISQLTNPTSAEAFKQDTASNITVQKSVQGNISNTETLNKSAFSSGN